MQSKRFYNKKYEVMALKLFLRDLSMESGRWKNTRENFRLGRESGRWKKTVNLTEIDGLQVLDFLRNNLTVSVLKQTVVNIL
jgi:hypothetical protein